MPRSSRRSRSPRHSTGPGTSTRSLVIVSAIVVLVGVPVLVVLLASRQTVSSGASHPGPVVPASSDPHRPAAPFFKGVGDGVLPAYLLEVQRDEQHGAVQRETRQEEQTSGGAE